MTKPHAGVRHHATLALAVLVGAALIPKAAADPTASATTKWNKQDARVSDAKTLFPGDQKMLYEPTIAIDPTDPQNMLAFAIDLSVQNVDPEMWSVTRAYRSTNGGGTWIDEGPVRYTAAGDDITQSGDPVVLFDRGGTAYYASLASPPGRGGGIYVHRSRDGGTTWDVPVLAVAEKEDTEEDVCTGTDKEWLSADPKTGDLYLTFTLFTFTCSSTGAPTDTYTRLSDIGVYLTRSVDGGTTWAEPHEIWKGYALGSIPKAGPDGTLYTTFWATVATPPTACPTAIGLLAAKGGGRPFISIVAGSSNDQGETWTFHRQPICDFIAGEILKPGRFVGGSFMPSIAIDQATGGVFIAYPSFIGGRFTVELISSTDGGESWTAPVEVTPGPNDARMPVVHAYRGIVRLVYVETTGMKDQNDQTTDGTAQTMYVESLDHGGTWSAPFPLSTKVGHPKEFTELGDYIALDVAGRRIAAIWTDARNGDEPGEIWARAGSIRRVEGVAIDEATSGVATQRARPADAAGLLLPVAPSHRGVAGPTAALPREQCVGQHKRLMRALRARADETVVVSCSVAGVVRATLRAARGLGHDVLLTDYESFEAETVLAAGKQLVLVKVTRGESPRSSRAYVHTL